MQYKQRIAEDKVNLNIMIPITCCIKCQRFLLVTNILLQTQFCSRVTKGVPWLRAADCVVFGVVYDV